MIDSAELKIKTRYLDDLERLPANGNPYWLRQIRAMGRTLFRETDFPNKHMEEWRQTNISDIVETPYHSLLSPTPHALRGDDLAPFQYGESAWHELVFVDGYFDAALSRLGALPADAYAGGLSAALHGPGAAALERHLNARLRDRNAYTALNSAFLQDGAFVHVPRNTVIEHPIHLIFIAAHGQPGWAAHIRNVIVLEEGAQASVLISYVSLAGETPYLDNIVEEISVGPNAHLRYCRLAEEGAAGNHLATIEMRQERDSSIKAFAFTLSGAIVRNQFCAELDGEGAECALNGLYLNDGARMIDNTLSVRHVRPQATSRIHFKGILDDNSKAVFTGKVFVHPEALKTDSNQLNNSLLLSDRATIDAKPQLEIYADDVKCTHGATVGPAPEDVLFYFRSRGIDERTARGMLTRGFAEEILEQLELEPVKKRLSARVAAKYAAVGGQEQ